MTSEQRAGRDGGRGASRRCAGRLDLRFEARRPGRARGPRRARVHARCRTRPRRAPVGGAARAGLPRGRPLGRLPAPLARDLPSSGTASIRRRSGSPRPSTACPSCTARRCAAPSSSPRRAAIRPRRCCRSRRSCARVWSRPRGIHIDSKSGVSGAGRTLADGYLFAELDGELPRLQARLRAPPRARDRAGGERASRASRCA